MVSMMSYIFSVRGFGHPVSLKPHFGHPVMKILAKTLPDTKCFGTDFLKNVNFKQITDHFILNSANANTSLKDAFFDKNLDTL